MPGHTDGTSHARNDLCLAISRALLQEVPALKFTPHGVTFTSKIRSCMCQIMTSVPAPSSRQSLTR